MTENLITIDMAAVEAEGERLMRERADARRRFEDAQVALGEADAAINVHQQTVAALRQYGRVVGNGSTTTATPTSDYSGITAMAAAERFVEEHTGSMWKLSDMIEVIHTNGCNGTDNALQVAFATMAKDGLIERKTRGHYKLLPPVSEFAAAAIQRAERLDE